MSCLFLFKEAIDVRRSLLFLVPGFFKSIIIAYLDLQSCSMHLRIVQIFDISSAI